MMKTTVFVILDAFRWDYINPKDTPFLNNLAKNGIYAKKLISTAGFTQRSAIFCGTYPNRTKNLMMFIKDNNSPFFFLKPHQNILYNVQKTINFCLSVSEKNNSIISKTIKKGARTADYILKYKLIKPKAEKYVSYAPPASIPFHLLPFIGVSEDKKEIYSYKGMSKESIFDIFHEENISFEYLMHPISIGGDDDTQRLAIQQIYHGSSLYLMQFAESDSGCHLYGPNSTKRHEIAAKIDTRLRELDKFFKEKFDDITWIIMGDHGMTDVQQIFDVQSVVETYGAKEGLRHGEDYLLFLDSTFARIWPLKEPANSFVHTIFEKHEFKGKGMVIDEETASKYRMPYNDDQYGKVIWWANPGVLIYPDYFHPRGLLVKGMHGYDSYHEDMKGFAIVYSREIPNKNISEVRLVDICPTICDILGVRYPESNEGVSLLNRGKHHAAE